METIKTTRYLSPAGEMILGSLGDRLCLCDWAAEKRLSATERRICRHLGAKYEEGMSETIRLAMTQLDDYFAGHRRTFTVPLLQAGTGFQCRVWAELSKTAYGTTISYAELARRTGNPKAVRAVASANAANPISIFVPCHRVIGSDNRLTGYAGGVAAKQLLLALEARLSGYMLPL